MLAEVNRGMGVEGFQKEFILKDSIYAVTNIWNMGTKDTVVHAWHSHWPMTMFSDDDEQGYDFEGSHMSSEKKMMSDLLTYAKNTFRVHH